MKESSTEDFTYINDICLHLEINEYKNIYLFDFDLDKVILYLEKNHSNIKVNYFSVSPNTTTATNIKMRLTKIYELSNNTQEFIIETLDKILIGLEPGKSVVIDNLINTEDSYEKVKKYINDKGLIDILVSAESTYASKFIKVTLYRKHKLKPELQKKILINRLKIMSAELNKTKQHFHEFEIDTTALKEAEDKIDSFIIKNRGEE